LKRTSTRAYALPMILFEEHHAGPPAEPALSFLIIHETKGVKIIDDIPVVFADGVAYQVEYDYR